MAAKFVKLIGIITGDGVHKLRKIEATAIFIESKWFGLKKIEHKVKVTKDTRSLIGRWQPAGDVPRAIEFNVGTRQLIEMAYLDYQMQEAARNKELEEIFGLKRTKPTPKKDISESLGKTGIKSDYYRRSEPSRVDSGDTTDHLRNAAVASSFWSDPSPSYSTSSGSSSSSCDSSSSSSGGSSFSSCD